MAERAPPRPIIPWTTQAMIIGHSYIRRLMQAMPGYPGVPSYDRDQNEMERNFGLAEFLISYYGMPSATIDSLQQKKHDILRERPAIIIMQVGGNDFSGDDLADHTEVANNLIKLAKDMRQGHAEVVVIGKLFYRKTSRHLPTEVQVIKYNDKVKITNDELQAKAKILLDDKILVWNHKGRELMRDEIIGPDGTHLNQLGMKKFYKSIRGALITAQRLRQPGMFGNTILNDTIKLERIRSKNMHFLLDVVIK